MEVNAIGAQTPFSNGSDLNRVYAKGTGQTEQITDNVLKMRVKRVVAINQGGSYPRNTPAYLPNNNHLYEDDGSYMRKCEYAGITLPSGELLKAGEVLKENPVFFQFQSPLAWTKFSTAVFDTVNTGYSPAGFDQTLGNPARPQKTSLQHFVFPEIPLADWNSAGDKSRYDKEVVDINLRNAKKVAGLLVVPGSDATTTNE